jgi:hypothetical protein
LNYTKYRFYTQNLFTKYGKVQDLKEIWVRNGGFRPAILPSFSKTFSDKEEEGEGDGTFGGIFCNIFGRNLLFSFRQGV